MSSSILLTPRGSRSFHEFTHMATAGSSNNHGLTFYEDLYLRPHRKSTSMPCRNVSKSSTENVARTKRQSSVNESQRRSMSRSPTNNPLLDSPPSARPLTLAAKAKSKDNQTATLAACDSDDNNNDYLRLCKARNMLPSPSKHKDSASTIYENHPFISTRMSHKSTKNSMPSQNPEHLYEVIPAQQQGQAGPSHSYYQRIRYFTDESNYILPSSAAKPNYILSSSAAKPNYILSSAAAKPNESARPPIKQGPPNSAQSPTNLRTMRRIGRSVDSIKSVPGNKLRSQSTTLAPQLWMKNTRHARLGSSASCDNIVGTELEFGRMPRGFANNLEKENNNPYTCISKPTRRNRLEESVRQVNGNSGTHHSSMTAAMRGSHSGNKQNKCQHRHSSSYSGSLSAYENIEKIHQKMAQPAQECANYVNIKGCQLQEGPDLNYADLDFTLPKQKEKPKTVISNRTSRSATPTKSTAATATPSEENEDTVEYTLINIAATEAARLACAEHQQYRQRHSHSTRTPPT